MLAGALDDPRLDRRQTVGDSGEGCAERKALQVPDEIVGLLALQANPDFVPIVLTGTDEGQLQVIAEVLEVLGAQP